MRCKKCKSGKITKAGYKVVGGIKTQRYQCQNCGYVFTRKHK